VPGFPIRTSSDPRSVDNSPRHIAASHVLHRLPVPRHPPCALKHLQHKTKSLKNFEIAHQHTRENHRPRKGGDHHACSMLATTIHKSNTTPHHQSMGQQPANLPCGQAAHLRFPTKQGEEVTGLLSQSPIVCLAVHRRPPISRSRGPACLSCTRTTPTTGAAHPSNRPRSPNSHTMWAGLGLVVLLRKEVIQPHLPVRLPCYDFVPIADPTFDGSPPYGLGHRLRVLPTFMT
jgi:hypothetical protein